MNPPAGSKRGLCGHCNANNFIAEIERGQSRRLQRLMWKLCDENRRLGGSYWKTVLREYGMKESDVWRSLPNPKLTGAERPV